ncbi:MAG TPA: adenosylcobinamide-GDP ribazoletransferase [Clostridiales bacterium]|nr:adenosylcobinamide-GDP ribazoletransferase [Clostridiales bacterium]
MLLMLKRCLLAMQLMTRIPIPVSFDIKEQDFAKGIVFFPVVGLAVGAVVAFVYWVVYGVFLSPPVAIIAALIAQTLVTGAMHLDGLGDTFDGLFCNKDRDTMLRVMKDSRIGSNGLIAIVFALLLKLFMLWELGPVGLSTVLITLPMAGRWGIIIACCTCSGVKGRKRGLGDLCLEGAGTAQLVWGGLLTLVLMALFLKTLAVVVVVIILISALLTSKLMERRLGGLTGDTLGAVNEICEIIFLFILLGVRRFWWI